MKGFIGWFCEGCNSVNNPVICEIFLNWYCPSCDIWLETFECDNDKCICKNRPNTPSMVEWIRGKND